MNKIPSIKRWWQNFGFGIHSKTDYEFLHNVIREKLPYYFYDELKKTFPNLSEKKSKTAHLLFRVCNAKKNKHIILIGEYDVYETTAIKKALGYVPGIYNKLITNHNSDVVIVKNIDKINAIIWKSIIEEKSSITYDMVTIGIAIYDKTRYYENYKILTP